MGYEEANEALNILFDLERSLRLAHDRDPEQEVRGIALPPIDRALGLAADEVGEHPVVQAVRDVISPEQVAEGDPVRAVDALHVVTLLYGILLRRVDEMASEQPGVTRRRRA